MSKFVINPQVDFAFKKLFSEDEEILLSFINAVLSEKNQITRATLLNPQNDKDHNSDHYSILDIATEDEQGRCYDIEMQVAGQEAFHRHPLYNWARLYTRQLKKNMPYMALKKTICINVLNFKFLENEPHYHTQLKLASQDTKQAYFDDIELHFIELPKFNKDLAHMKTMLDRWVTFLNKAADYLQTEIPPELDEHPEIHKAFNILEHISLNEADRLIYERRLKLLSDTQGIIECARSEGQLEGDAEGCAAGLEKGKMQEK